MLLKNYEFASHTDTDRYLKEERKCRKSVGNEKRVSGESSRALRLERAGLMIAAFGLQSPLRGAFAALRRLNCWRNFSNGWFEPNQRS